jgi:hypothetical protein
MVEGVFGPGKCHLGDHCRHLVLSLRARYKCRKCNNLPERCFSAAGRIFTPSRAGVTSTDSFWSPMLSNETWIYFRVLHKSSKKSKRVIRTRSLTLIFLQYLRSLTFKIHVCSLLLLEKLSCPRSVYLYAVLYTSTPFCTRPPSLRI